MYILEKFGRDSWPSCAGSIRFMFLIGLLPFKEAIDAPGLCAYGLQSTTILQPVAMFVNSAVTGQLADATGDFACLLWSPYVIGQTIIFSSCFFLSSSSSSFFFFSSPNLSGRRLDVYHTLAHGVALVRI